MQQIINETAILREKIGYLYFIHCENRIKIGITTNPVPLRVTELQTGNPFELSLVAYTANEFIMDLEKEIHKYFSPFHIRGEWYEWNEIIQLFSWIYCKKIINPNFYESYITSIRGIDNILFDSMSNLMSDFWIDSIKPYNNKAITKEKIEIINSVLQVYKDAY